MRLREQGQDDLADRLAAELPAERPRAAYSHDEHKQAERQGFNLAALRQSLKIIAEQAQEQQSHALAELINSNGLELADALTTGRGRSRIMIELPDGVKDHNANRTLKIKVPQVAAFINQTKEHLDAIRPDTTDQRGSLAGSTSADNQRSGADTSIKSSNDTAPERTTQSVASDQQELAQAATELQPLAAKFTVSRHGDLTAADIDAPPDPNDPNLMLKLAAMLGRSLANENVRSNIPHP